MVSGNVSEITLHVDIDTRLADELKAKLERKLAEQTEAEQACDAIRSALAMLVDPSYATVSNDWLGAAVRSTLERLMRGS